MGIDKKSLGAAVKSVRVDRGLTQLQLAQAAGLANNGNVVALIERGERGVSLETLNALADALQVPAACLVLWGSTHDEPASPAGRVLSALRELAMAAMMNRPLNPGGPTSGTPKASG